MTDTPAPSALRAGAVRAVKPRAVRRRTAKVLAPTIAAFAITGIGLVAVAQAIAPAPAESNVAQSVQDLAQAQAQGYGAALVGSEEPQVDVSVSEDRGESVGEVTVTTPEPEPDPVSTGGGSTGDAGESTDSGGGTDYSGLDAPPADPGSAQAIAQEMVSARGWGADEYACLYNLWMRESGWNVYAQNPSSGAYGIPQSLPGDKMASHGGDWQTNPATQIAWGLDYIAGRYGTPCVAWGHSESVGWY